MRLMFLICCLIPMLVQAQNKLDLINKADSFFQQKNYAEAVKLADQYFATDSCDGCAYNAAVYNIYAGNKQKAIMYLKKAFMLGYGAGALDQETDFAPLHNEPEWPAIVKMGKDSYDGLLENYYVKQGKMLKQKYTDIQRQLESQSMITVNGLDTTGSSLEVYNRLASFNQYRPLASTGKYLYLYYKVNDSVSMPYLVVMPNAYTPETAHALLVVLHGAISMTGKKPPYYADSSAEGRFHRHFAKYSSLHNMIVVYPMATKKYNWMYPDNGFGITTGIIRYLKHLINIDDDAIYVTGHSNGATGSFSYLMKEPSLFASFSGMNTQPMVRTGGTFLQNAINRSFYNIGTDKDYYFPPWGNDTLNNLMHNLGVDWTVDMHKGYPHWFPQFDAADESVKNMFTAMLAKKRNPFNHSIYWECDDTTYGKCDWLKITALDTLQKPASWHKTYNFNIHPWIDNQNPDSIIDVTKPAFQYPRKSGAIKAVFANNVLTITSSCVKNIRLFISPQMVNLSKPIKIIVNNKHVYSNKIGYDKAFMLANFSTEFDRKAVWVNYIDVLVQ